jgi:hypothetical protein
MRKNLLSNLIDDFNDSLKNDDLKDLKNFSIMPSSKNFESEQKYAKIKLDYAELVNIIPKNPMFPPGTIIGCINKEEKSDSDTEESLMAYKKGCDDDDDCAFSEKNSVVLLHALPTVKKLLNTNALVTNEVIEIRKFVVIKEGFDSTHNSQSTSISYEITHFLYLINGNKKFVSPTSLFDKENSRRRRMKTLSCEELDINYIEKIYDATDPDEIIKPLQILSKP